MGERKEPTPPPEGKKPEPPPAPPLKNGDQSAPDWEGRDKIVYLSGKIDGVLEGIDRCMSIIKHAAGGSQMPTVHAVINAQLKAYRGKFVEGMKKATAKKAEESEGG